MSFLFSQEEQSGIKPAPSYDTNYYRTYEDRLVIALYQASQNYNMEIKQTSIADKAGISHINYFSDAATVNGIVIDYDKLCLSFAYKTLPQLDSYKKGNNKAGGIGLSLGGDKWQLEANIKTYKWFYDLSTALYDTSYRDSMPYYQNPSMNVNNLKFKFMYFTNNKKFSYQSAYACNERQLKSAFSPVFVANLYVNTTKADSSFIPYFIRSFYGYNADVNAMRTIAYTAGGGVTGTLVVYKRFFINGMFTLGLESQYNQYHHNSTGVTNKANYINWAADLRMAAGFNNRNFFMIVNLINDLSQYQSNVFNLNTNFKSFSFTIGYRFKVREPRFMPKVRATKLYQLF